MDVTEEEPDGIMQSEGEDDETDWGTTKADEIKKNIYVGDVTEEEPDGGKQSEEEVGEPDDIMHTGETKTDEIIHKKDKDIGSEETKEGTIAANTIEGNVYIVDVNIPWIRSTLV